MEPTQYYNQEIINGESGIVNIPISISEDIELGAAEFDISLSSNYTDNYMNELVFEKNYQKIIDISLYQNGFPYIISSQVITSPAIADIDFDNYKEIIFGDYLGLLHIID